MILWTIQDYIAYENLMDTGILIANEDYVFEKELFAPAHNWLFEQMGKRVGPPPPGLKYPVWAWYQWEGKRKPPDMRRRGYTEPGKKIVRLTIDVDPSSILLSDFDLYHYALNYWYLALNENEDITFEKECKSLGFSREHILNRDINTTEILAIREKIEDSWSRIFDLELETNDWIIELMESKSIQATMWSVRKEEIINSKVFKAR